MWGVSQPIFNKAFITFFIKKRNLDSSGLESGLTCNVLSVLCTLIKSKALSNIPKIVIYVSDDFGVFIDVYFKSEESDFIRVGDKSFLCA